MESFFFADTAEFYRIGARIKLDPKRRSDLGQFFTPVPIGRFMASLFENLTGDLRVLDPGAGVGTLTAALAERFCKADVKPHSISLICYEIEPILTSYLKTMLGEVSLHCDQNKIDLQSVIHEEDFIVDSRIGMKPDLFLPSEDTASFTHVIMNPPYKKIASSSVHRSVLRKVGIETTNLYSGFLFLAARALADGGELVAIVPRSFCNGPYFKDFREKFLAEMALRHIHIFEKRNIAFKGDDVLQENIIIHAIKGKKPSDVRITTSRNCAFRTNGVDSEYFTCDMTHHTVPYTSVIHPSDPDKFIHIPRNDLDQIIGNCMGYFTTKLDDLGIKVSTGPVMDFRLRSELSTDLEEGTVPLLYTHHFQGGKLEWPKVMSKPNAIRVSNNSRKWLWKNKGHYVVTRRFTAKEEQRRIVASVYGSDLPGDLIGFENHLNVYHAERVGIPQGLARGLAIFLNSSLVDRFFRQFNGHTQVNATDLRSLGYPDREVLERIGRNSLCSIQSQQDIDFIIEEELWNMTKDIDQLRAKQKIDDALKILKKLGMPKAQQNERSALTLLALLGLKPAGSWNKLEKPLIGITPIMDFIRQHFAKEYAPNTRETFRKETMHQFVEAGITRYNPDNPSRPPNSPDACYQISDVALKVMLTYGTDQWENELSNYREVSPSLADKYAKPREMQRIPVKIASGKEINLAPGKHSELIKSIIKEFAPRFAPGSEVIYVGDTENKNKFFEEKRLSQLGVTLDKHGKMPDVVLYFKEKEWLFLIESVTSHGPVDAKRYNELSSLFHESKPSIVYVTAFLDRRTMSRFLSEISWETEVWCADSPTHLIHFNGERFLGPYNIPE